MALSLRLDRQLSRRLASAAKAKGVSKSEFVRTCLHDYLKSMEQELTAWELGKDLFGCWDSGQGDLSSRARNIVRERIRAKRAGHSRG